MAVILSRPQWVNKQISYSNRGAKPLCIIMYTLVNTLRPRQNDRHFTDDIFKCTFWDENIWKASDAELWYFLWSAPEQTVEQTTKTPPRWLLHHCNGMKTASRERLAEQEHAATHNTEYVSYLNRVQYTCVSQFVSNTYTYTSGV